MGIHGSTASALSVCMAYTCFRRRDVLDQTMAIAVWRSYIYCRRRNCTFPRWYNLCPTAFISVFSFWRLSQVILFLSTKDPGSFFLEHDRLQHCSLCSNEKE